MVSSGTYDFSAANADVSDIVAYKATNSINGKCYVGITIRFETRKCKHIWESNNGSPLSY